MKLPLPCEPAISAEDLARLEREFATYRRELIKLIADGHGGRFALIRENAVLGIWNSPSEASEEGRRRFGMDPITVKRIDPRDLDRLPALDLRTGETCRS